MALTELTKVTGPGIHTLSNVLSHNIKSSGIITATKFSGPLDSIGGNFSGVVTATNGVFSGNISCHLLLCKYFKENLELKRPFLMTIGWYFVELLLFFLQFF